jgi:hypothetical protein
MDARGTRLVIGLLAAGAWFGCENRATPVDAGSNEPSPNASILPAPLSSAPERSEPSPEGGLPADAGVDADAGEVETLREDVALASDTADLRDAYGFALKARFGFPGGPPPPKPPEASAEALDRARASASFDVEIELGAGRLRLTLTSDGFLLAGGTELRTKIGLLGHVLVFPDQTRYVTIRPGALRAVLNERRTDATELQRVSVGSMGNGRVLGFPSEKSLLVTPLGRFELEQIRVPGALENGVTLCRLLAELAGVHPDSPVCTADLIPVRAEYISSAGGRLSFEVSHIERAPSFETGALQVPPASAEHRIGELPTPRSPLLLSPGEARGLRLRASPTEPKDGVKDGLLLQNLDHLEKYVLLDGVPVARVSPGVGELVLDLLPGSYTVSVRSFLGDDVTAPATTTVPSKLVIGAPSDVAPAASSR